VSTVLTGIVERVGQGAPRSRRELGRAA